MADRQGPGAAGCRQLPGRGRTQSRQVAQSAGAPARAGRAWGPSFGEPQARRDGRQERHRVRVDLAADEDAGHDRIDRGPDRVAVSRARRGVPRYSALAPEIRTTSRQISRSLAAYASAASGVLESTFAPAVSARAFIAGSAAMDLMAALNLSITGRGVPFGTTNAAHEVTTKSARPASAIVGTFGKVGQRSADVTASGRICPPSMTEM